MKNNQEVWQNHYSRERSKLSFPDENVVRFFRKLTTAKKLEKKAIILDLGCGSGRHQEFLIQEGFNVIGQDFASNAFKNIKNNICADVSSLPYKTSSLDSILCWGVIHYLQTDMIQPALDEIYRCLKPDSTVLATIRASEDSHLKVVLKEGDLSQGQASLFTLEESLALFSKFSIIESGFILRRPLAETNTIAHHIISATK